MFGREYKMDLALPDGKKVECVYTMFPVEKSETGVRVDWKLPAIEPLPKETVLLLDEYVCEHCTEHYREHSGDVSQPGPQGGEVP